ncbi:hypothetical protein [Priestia megaterium]|uniref:hypothetical protein n=1 Tax=Priestia megaterium TaxID=1404 RepID=UPI000BFB291A|nr:hypothetical protein [Priestia megaterium]PGQ88376.1 hypothetical protein COA18_05445 [Priestia megaterium]
MHGLAKLAEDNQSITNFAYFGSAIPTAAGSALFAKKFHKQPDIAIPNGLTAGSISNLYEGSKSESKGNGG